MAFVGGGAAVRRQPLFSAMKQPSLIKQLRGILAEYPDGGQILKELIQNAEDAGAREVKILFDAGSNSRDAVDQEPEFTKFFQTPALCVYNDAVFTDQDWEGIKMIYSSIKEEDKSKVGRFGLGFKSVFHITDYPCIISGDQMLLIDPQKPPERVNARFEIPGLHDPWEGLDMNDFYKGLGGHFGIDHSMINDGRYSGTLFWFPLRKRPSPLSENLYDERKILDLFDGLKSEAPSILIFLRSLESLSIYTATENDHSTKVLKSQKKKHLSLHVSIKNAKDHVRQSREKFYAKMETNRSDVASMTDYCIEITDKARVTDHHWVVLNYFAGNFASERFQTLIDDKDLSMSPCVSIAVSLDRINQPFEGHIYCFMPLPKEGSKLTGLSFHVNGFFALSQNRHHMKWVTDEQKMQKVFDKNVLWNQYMVNEALPKAFQVIYLSLVRRAKQNGNSITDVMNVYRLLPNVNNVLDKWRKFIYNALSLVKPEKILFCRDLNDWISLQKSVFASFDNLPRHLEHVRSSVKECLKCMGHYLVEVPHEIVSTFKLIFPRQVTDVTPMLLAGYMRQNIKYIELDDKTKFNILDYLVSDGDSTKLESLHLILLASREWAAFSQQGKPIYICNENIVSLFPWMANRFLAPDAHSTSTETFCVSGLFQLREFTDSEMKTFLQKTMSKNLDITSTVSETSPINIQWLEKVWRVIGGNIDKFASLPLVPYLQSGRFLSRYTVKLIPLSTPFLVVAACRGATVPNELVRPLNLLGMTVLPDVPPFVHQYAAHILKWPYTEKLVQILNGIAASSNQWSFIDKFNKSSSNEDKVALFKFLTRSSTLNEHGKSFITSLNIFPVVHDGIMNTSFGDLRAVNSFVEQSVLDNVPRNVPLPYPCVLGEDQQGRFLQTLGLKELTLEIFFEEKLTIMSAKGFTEETKLTMISFLSNIQLFKRNYRLLGLAAFIPFLLKGKVRVKASDLFDSLDRNVERLFVGQDNLYENKNELNKSHDELKMIGLKGYNDISVDEIYTVAKTLDSWSRNNNHLDDIVEKAKAFQEYIEKHPEILQKGLRSGKKTFGEAILNLQCFTNFKEMFDGADELCKQSFSLSMPSNLKLTHHWKLVCLVRPVVETHCRCLAMFYQWHEQPSVDDVLENLNRVKTVMTRGQYVQTLRLMVAEAFQYLHKKLKESIDRRQTFVQNALVWTEEGFCVPDKAILLREDVSSINFSPYFKFIPREFKYMRDLFVGIGCNLTEDKHVLAHFLHDIRKTYLKRVLATNTDFDRARVVSALDRLASKDIDKDWLKENVIVLIDSPENQIKFASITDCVYDDEPEMFDETCTEEAKLKQVHPSLSKQTVVKLGVKSVAHRTLLDAEDIGFEEWGQREKLTDRLNKLLTNGYTDGLSVPKELIQNADDAHATEVSFLYDERRNDDAKKRLFSKQLDKCQGPALWVHNNAVFSANDLRNITKLNGETKTSKTTIGKFGLGFCSVYNLTDVPSFISGKNLVMFDPNETYIQEVRARPSTGIKVPLSKRLIIRRHEDQFKPFEGVFGCKVLDESFQSYDNTLFRLPLRTSHQAGVSKISQKVYSREEVKELLTMIMKTAGNHLLFCQNVKKVNIYHLVDGKSPSESRLCFTVQKSLLTCQHIGRNIVEQAENLFARKVNLSSNQTIRIRQQCLTIDLWTKSKQRQYENETDWIVTWYMSSDIKYQSGHLKSMLPLTAIASPVDIGRKNAMFLKDLPFGFYKEGHLFCFLPLPVTSGLQVHINGFFSVTSDRRGLSLANEDDKSNKLDIHWNKALLTTSAVKAFTCHLLSIITTCDIVDIYSLFPEECKEIVTSFVSSFYQNIVQCNSKLFKGESQYYSFNEIQMLDESVCHEKALLEVIYNMLNGIQRNDMKVVVKIPNFVLRKLLKYNATELEKVNQSVISMTHVMKIFLQTITSTYWMGKDDQRNLLLQHTVIHGNNEIRQMLKEIPCFPTEPWGLLRKITELVSPSSTIAKLFRVSDERFISNNSGLRQEYFVSKLVDLGMQEKFLSPLLLLDRCLSISKYIEECTECCKMQIQRVLRYLLSLHDIKELEKSHEIEKIRQTPFLPVLSKPKDWVFSWKADASNKLIIGKDITCQNHTYTSNPPIVIGNPMDLFSFDRSYIGSVQFIYNESFSSQVRLPPAMKMLLNIRDKVSVGILLEQLGCLADEASTLNQYFNKMTQHICDSVYESLDALIINMEDNCFQKLAMEMCAEILTKPIILIGKDLVCPKNVALNMKTSSPPDLYCPQNLPLSQLRVFQKFGMKTHFRVVDIVHVLNEKKMKWYGKPCLEIQNILNLLVNLEDCMTTEGKSYDDFEEFHDIIIAPDVNKYLHPTFMLAVEDVDIVSLEGLLLMHGDISQNLAKSVGVKTKKIQFMQRISTVIPFGQCEKLTTRLNGLLKDYPCDESIMKELIQNSDDAGATEIHFIKFYGGNDERESLEHHGQNLPALCVYNDSYFREGDFKGIKNLGEGSKSNDPTKTGQFGVGFNAVYHLTDCPSFITKGPDMPSGGELVMFDPLLRYIGEYSGNEYGIRVEMKHLLEQYPGTLSNYPPLKGQVGTMFRLPLRTDGSPISNHVLTEQQLDILFEKFTQAAGNCLHFLKNIKCIKFMTCFNNDLKKLFSVETQMSQTDTKKRSSFFRKVHSTCLQHENKLQNTRIEQFSTTYKMVIKNSKGNAIPWLIVQNFGIKQNEREIDPHITKAFDEGELGLLPLGGVSMQLCETDPRAYITSHIDQHKTPSDPKHEAFAGIAYCFLPLPVNTGMPFNINGHFALDRGRRSLWDEGYRKSWNEYILKKIISEALKSALVYMQKYWVENYKDLMTNTIAIRVCLSLYYNNWPRYASAKDDDWKYFVKAFYGKVFSSQYTIFALPNRTEIPNKQKKRKVQCAIQWVGPARNNTDTTGGIFNIVYQYISRANMFTRENAKDVELTIARLGWQLISKVPSDILETLTLTECTEAVYTDPKFLLTVIKQENRYDLPLTDTVYKTPQTVASLLRFVWIEETFKEEIIALPLSVSNDNFVRRFDPSTPLFCSEFHCLLPGSKQAFVHSDLVSLMSIENTLFEKNVIRELTVKYLSDLLPQSYPNYRSGTNMKWKFEKKALVTPLTVFSLFKFIATMSINKKSSDDKHVIDNDLFQSNVKLFDAWSLLPSVSSFGETEIHELIPIKNRHELLYINHGNDQIYTILRRLNIPSLDSDVFENDLDIIYRLGKMLASTQNPAELLKCTVHYSRRIAMCDITSDEAIDLLRFFSKCKGEIQQNLKEDTDHYFKSLPLFETVHDVHFTSVQDMNRVVVVPILIPKQGFQALSESTSICFLKHWFVLEDLHRFLKFECPTPLDIYLDIILSRFHIIEEKDLLVHVKFIRDELHTTAIKKGLKEKRMRIYQILRNIPFIQTERGLKRVSDFFDQRNEVFRCFERSECFLPDEYCAEEWTPFLTELGLKTAPDGETVIAYAKKVARNTAMDGIDEDVLKQSEILTRCIYGEFYDTFEKNVLCQLKDIKFVTPYIVSEDKLSIVKSYGESGILIHFNGACHYMHEDLCWSSAYLLQNVPQQDISKALGILEEPTVDQVLTHCQNITDVFYNDFGNDENKYADKMYYMSAIYNSLSLRKGDICSRRLIHAHFVLIPDEAMVNISDVFTGSSEYDEIRPYLYKAPKCFRKYFDLFESVGASETVTCLHYVSVLEAVHTQFGDSELPSSVLYTVSKAVQRLFELLVEKSQFEKLGRQKLFLPSFKKKLCASTSLTVSNNTYFENKLKGNRELEYFIGFNQLDINSFRDPVEPFLLLPETVRPEILTDYVQEVVVTDGMEMLESSDADNWETFLRSDYFIEGIIRLLRYQTKFETATIGLNGTDEISIIDLLSNLKIKQVNGLKTMLKYKGNIVQGTESMKTCFIRNTDIDLVANSEQGKVRYELYFQVASNSSSYTIQHKLFTEADGLIKLVDLCTLCKLSKFTSHCVRDLMALMDRPQMISLELDQRKVDAYNLPFGFLRSAFPSPGTYVEPRFFPFMVQGIMPFKRHEYMYAALEIDNEHVNDETDRDDDMEDEMFIYVHIVHEIRNPNEISQLSTRYVVNVGNRFENRVEVPIYRLYKFLPQQQDNGQDIVEYDSEPVGSLPFDDNCRRIRDILREAFKLPLKDRKAVIRRLIKKWHPDKNEGREEYCTRVFNYMKDVILRLERGENIEGEINAATGMSEPDMSDSCYRDTATTAYNLGARYARGFKENIDDYNRSNRQGNYAHRSSNTCARPSVGESKRWLRQAKRDFTSARTALECSEHSSKPCYNWICFICHQACEKSLKAAWFSKDANLCPRRSHSLATIADNLGHTLLEEEARRFEENLQIAGHSYFRLRYPDSVYGNDIPSDVFDKDDAEFAVEATERILDMVDDFVQ